MLIIDYLDADVAYLLGMLVARGELHQSENLYRMIVHFPKGALAAQGETVHFDTDRELRLGMERIRERLSELLGADIRTSESNESWDLVSRFTRKTMAWRNIFMHLEGNTSFTHYEIPKVILDRNTPIEYKREFVKGFADVAGNIRPANRDQGGRHRVRLDVLNYQSNWKLPVQLCNLLQNDIGVAVPGITWGHPNLNREWREHQINIYAEEFTKIGFYFDYKQEALNELADLNRRRFPNEVRGCPGARRVARIKPHSDEENSSERLPVELVGQHCDAYWQICRALGCTRRPQPDAQMELVPDESE